MKKLLVLVLSLVMAISVLGAVTVASADQATGTVTVAGQPNTDWVHGAGNDPTSATFTEDGYTTITGLAAWGYRSNYTYKVALDGLSIRFKTNAYAGGDMLGFVLGGLGQYCGESPLTISLWKGIYSGQARLNFGANHDYNGASVVYKDSALSGTGFGVASSMVLNDVAAYDLSITFNKVDDTMYSVTIASYIANVVWGNNANYTDANLSDGAVAASTVYLKAETIAPALDENGNLYVTAIGFPSGSNPAPSYSVKITDANYNAYVESVVTPAAAALANYQTAVGAIVDEATYVAAMEARAELVGFMGGLRSYEKLYAATTLEAIDGAISSNEDVAAIVKGIVSDDITAAKDAFLAFENEEALNDESLAAAKALVVTAKQTYDDKKAQLTAAAVEELDAAFADLDYTAAKATVINWIIKYEAEINALDTTSESIGDELAAVKAIRSSYTGSSVEAIVTGTLVADDAEAVNARLATADEALNAVEENAAVALKTKYLVDAEAAAAEDMTIWNNVLAAFGKIEVLKANVEITEADGELYTRYSAVVAAVDQACEQYVLGAIEAVDTALDGNFEALNDFVAVRGQFKAITLEYLNEGSEAYADIVAAYDAVAAKLEANVWYNFASTGNTVVEQNTSGIYFEQIGQHPNRLNYNKKLDLTVGVEFEVELTQMAYFNGDFAEDGTSKGANNICINLLSEQNKYKSEANGVNIIIWLFATESNVQIVNNKDVPIANAAIATPIAGGTLSVSVKYEAAYYDFVMDSTYAAYVISVNEGTLIVPVSMLEDNEMTWSNECYLSVGSYSDYKADPNCFTLLSVNGVEFGYVEPITPPGDSTSEQPSDQEPADSNSSTGACNGSLSGSFSFILVAAVLALFRKRK